MPYKEKPWYDGLNLEWREDDDEAGHYFIVIYNGLAGIGDTKEDALDDLMMEAMKNLGIQ